MTDTRNLPRGESLGIAGIIGDSFSLTFSNFVGLLALIIAPFILTGIVGYLLFGSLFAELTVNPLAMQELMLSDPVGFWSRYAVVGLISILAFSFFYAAAVRLYFDSKLQTGTLGTAVAAGLSSMIRVFLMYLIVIVALVLIMGILGGVMGAMAATIGSEAVGFVLMIGLAVLTLWLFAVFTPFLAIVVVEKEWFGAFGRTFGLTSGYRWSIVGLLIVFFLSLIVVAIAIGLLLYASTLLGGIVGMILGIVIYLVMSIVLTGASIAVMSLVYVRLREIKEGASIQSLADVFS